MKETIDYEELLELVMDVAYELQCCGAETYRVEDCAKMILQSYGVKGEVFAVPNVLIVSMETPDGKHLNRMRRNLKGSTNLAGIDAFNGLSRSLCADAPSLDEGRARLIKTKNEVKFYNKGLYLLGHFMAAAGFGIFFGGAPVDFLLAGFAGMAAGLSNLFLDRFEANVFFKTAISSICLSFVAHILYLSGLGVCLDAAITGGIMVLVPGLLFTNTMRDLIYGDSLSGVNRLMQVLIITVALAVGIGAGGALSDALWAPAISSSKIHSSFLLMCAAITVSGFGFCIVFNAHGFDNAFCALGGLVGWITYYLCCDIGGLSEVVGFLVGAAAGAVYAESMARIRRRTATSYLVCALVPLIPGSVLYKTVAHALNAEIVSFLYESTHTVSLAGALAVGVLFASTCFRMWTLEKAKRMRLKSQHR